MSATALIVDDEVDLCRLIQITLTKMGIRCDVAYNTSMAYELLKNNSYSFCLTDMNLPDGSGLDLIKHINSLESDMPVAMITAHGDMDTAIEALKLGAFDFVSKPLELPRLKQLVNNALKVAQYSEQINHESTSETKSPLQQVLDERLIGDSEVMRRLKKTIVKVARSQAPVFLWGESGTGKEVVARLIHELGHRRTGNFVAVNCGAIPSELMESEFFGHKKGSFTGATSDKKGLFQQANGGTLFLDEVADLPLAMQVKLLRAIQEKSIRSIGDTTETFVDIRVLSATHKNLHQLVSSGNFRQDLFYRINVIELQLPTLNERIEDIPMLATHFLKLIADDWKLEEPLSLSADALEALQYYNFEGNVRELRNLLERAVTLSDDNVINSNSLRLQSKLTNTKIQKPVKKPVAKRGGSLAYQSMQAHFVNSYISNSSLKQTHSAKKTEDDPADDIERSANRIPAKPQERSSLTADSVQNRLHPKLVDALLKGLDKNTGLPTSGLESFLQKQERVLLINALHQTKGNKTQTAKLLDMSLRSLRYRLNKLNIEDK